MDGLTDPQVGAASAQVCDFILDVGVGWLPLLCDQRNSSHNLTGLAITAARHAAFDPRLLYRVLSTKPFDGRNRPALRLIDR
jgi:hypothetical protein